MSRVKIVGIIGSPRKNGASERLFNILETEVKALAPAAEIDRVILAGMKVQPCTGCDACLKGDCPLDKDDDYPIIVAKLLAADAIIIASPVYFFNVPGLLKNFIDRSRRMKMNRSMLKNKWFGTLVSSGLRNGGGENVTMLLFAWALSQGMLPISCLGNPVIEAVMPITTLQKDKVKEFRKPAEEDEIADKSAKRLAERLVELGGLLKK
ncbi:MAG: flavodoxin family protein [Candidatus Lokiarchaeota archaeon]|nr:flavodoxin family protein [Candidatus Lokiarchaeota archaeon]